MVMKDTMNNSTIVDVRTPEEYSGEHFPDAINIPLDQVNQRISEFKEMSKPIIAEAETEAGWQLPS